MVVAQQFSPDALLALVQANMMAVAATAAAVLVALVLLLGRRSKSSKPKVFLDATKFQPLTLARVDVLTHNTRRYVFSLPAPDMRLGLPTGQHITFLGRDTEENRDIYRPYTPTTDDDTVGSVEFAIKLYPTGKMSQILAKMEVGHTMLMKGPRGRFTYERNMKRAIGMLAGGSGITPMYQVAMATLKDPLDTTRISLLYGNLTADDIMLKAELDELAAKHPQRFSVFYVLNTPPPRWNGGSGFITRAMIEAHVPPPAENVLVLRCGPGPMNDAMKEQLNALGYDEATQQFQF